MIMKKFFVTAMLLFVACLSLSAQQSYYSSINGVKGGETLKNALHKLIDNKNTVDYGSGTARTWGAFYTTDFIMEDGKRRVADMYSDVKRYFGTKGKAVDGMNIEHSVAKSWWGGTENDAYRDLHHLNPSDQEANSRKSNYPMAKLTSVSWTNGIMNVGKANIAGSSQNAFEPADQYKGDFARTYMYMFTCYQTFTWKYTWMVYENSSYPTIKPWAVDLLLKWHHDDPVSQKEIDRNNAVYAIQGNRNPFVDYPRLADFVWGDSVDYTFYLYGDAEDGSGSQTGSGSSGSGGTGGSDGSTDEGGGESGGSSLSASKFTLVESGSSLAVGDTIIIVYGNVAMSTEQRANNRGITTVEVSGSEVVSIPADVQRIVIEKGTSSAAFAMNVGSGYLYAASSSSNYLRTQDEIDANASWKITIADGGAADVVAQGGNTRNLLRYNPSAKIFSCYKSGQNKVSIYAKRASSNTKVDAVKKPANRKVNVYNQSGKLLRSNVPFARAFYGLPQGVYVVDNEKYYIK